MAERLHTEPLGDQDRLGFDCGVSALNRYLREQAGQDQRRGVSRAFLVLSQGGGIAGFYTLAASGIASTALPIDVTKKLPRYPELPAALIGRLAVDLKFRRQGIGIGMIVDAVIRARQAAPAIFALLVDAKDEKVAEFYRHHGFEPIIGQSLRLFLTMSTAEKAMLGSV